MSDYTELIKDLRTASTVSTAWKRLSLDAAAAIEALQAQLPKRGEIVRCRECRWGYLCVTGQHLGLDGFCSKGEREVQE